jgi:hypothetical protein
MRVFFVLFIYLLALQAWAQGPQDIVLKTRFDYHSSLSFVQRLRAFLINNHFGDPYNQNIKKPIVIDLAQELEAMPSDTRAWIRELQSILQLKLFESKISLVIDGLYYSINDFNSELKPIFGESNRIEYVTLNYVKGLKIAAQRIFFEVELQKTHDGNPLTFGIELTHPEFDISSDVVMELPMGWQTNVLPKNLVLALESIDLRKIFSKVMENPSSIDFKTSGIVMPEVSIRVGKRELKFDTAKIKNFLNNHQEAMKIGILNLLKSKMQSRFGNIIKDSPKELVLPRTYEIKDNIHAVFDIQEVNANRTGIMQIDLDGHFCPVNEGLFEDYCRNNKIPSKLRRKIDVNAYDKSVREINRFLVEHKANIAISVSEHYLNQLIQSTVQGGSWEKALKGKDFKLGPETAFVLAEEKGPTFTLYLDIINKLKGFQRLLIGRSEIRFPVKLQIGLSTFKKDNIPYLEIIAKKVVTDEDLIIHGKPEFDLISTVGSARLKHKIAQQVLKEISAFEGQTLVVLPLRAFKDTYLEQLQFTSDGAGRGTAILDFEQTRK